MRPYAKILDIPMVAREEDQCIPPVDPLQYSYEQPIEFFEHVMRLPHAHRMTGMVRLPVLEENEIVAAGQPGKPPSRLDRLDGFDFVMSERFPASTRNVCRNGPASGKILRPEERDSAVEAGERRHGQPRRVAVDVVEESLGKGVRKAAALPGFEEALEEILLLEKRAERGVGVRPEVFPDELCGVQACEEGCLAGPALRQAGNTEGGIERDNTTLSVFQVSLAQRGDLPAAQSIETHERAGEERVD